MAIKNIINVVFNIVSAVFEKLFPLLYYIIIIGTISGIGSAFFSVSYLNSPGPLKEDKTIVITSGSSTIAIAKQLSENHIIQFPQLFAVLKKVSKSGKSLKAGEYAFAPSITPMAVLKKIESGDVVIRKITVAEGLYTSQILDLIKNDMTQKGDIPENVVEGELLPETYEYHYNDLRANMVKRMQDSMHKTLDELWEKRKEGLPLKSKDEALVLASIIEKETGNAEERKRVAGVFINRLKKNMRLQTDPSVIYAVTNGKYILTRPLSHKDLEIDSPYNTYLNSGLPPRPISNPGRASIEAALNPQDTDELYFVANGMGGHVFSSNLKQHNENVNKLRKFEKSLKK